MGEIENLESQRQIEIDLQKAIIAKQERDLKQVREFEKVFRKNHRAIQMEMNDLQKKEALEDFRMIYGRYNKNIPFDPCFDTLDPCNDSIRQRMIRRNQMQNNFDSNFDALKRDIEDQININHYQVNNRETYSPISADIDKTQSALLALIQQKKLNNSCGISLKPVYAQDNPPYCDINHQFLNSVNLYLYIISRLYSSKRPSLKFLKNVSRYFFQRRSNFFKISWRRLFFFLSKQELVFSINNRSRELNIISKQFFYIETVIKFD